MHETIEEWASGGQEAQKGWGFCLTSSGRRQLILRTISLIEAELESVFLGMSGISWVSQGQVRHCSLKLGDSHVNVHVKCSE